MDPELKKNLTATDQWIRLFFMVVFAIVGYVVQILIWIIAAIQFVITIITGKVNQNLHNFSNGLCVYAYHIIKYLTYITEEKPFPFSHWPESTENKK